MPARTSGVPCEREEERHPSPAGVGSGIVPALMGVAGGELLIPTIVLLFAVDIKIAGSLAARNFLDHHAGGVRQL
jgi:uncharacterized membrane protein YfcA